MGTESEVFRLDLDASDFIESLKSSQSALEKLGASSDSLSGLLSGIGSATALLGTMAVAFIAVKTAINWVEQAEQIKQVEAQFEMLSSQAGLSGEKLKEGMIAAAAGTINETELLKLSNKAMISLGDNAVKIPQIMELARKATAVFGGTSADTFEQINQAIASGNTRMLKHIGIKIDAVKAEKDYAASIGTTVGALSVSGKQAAIMNAVLSEGSEKFKNVNADALQTHTSLEVISAAAKTVGEAFVLAFEKLAGPAVRFFVDQLKQAAEWMKHAFSPDDVNALNSKLGDSYELLGSLNKRMVELNNGGTLTDKIFGNVEASKKTVSAHIQAVKDGIEKLQAQKAILDKGPDAKGTDETPISKSGKIDLDKQLAQETAFNKDVQKLRDANMKAQIAGERSIVEVEANAKAQALIVEQNFHQKVEELRVKATERKIIKKQADKMIALETQLRNQEIINLDKDLTDRKIAALDRFSATSKSASETFANGWTGAALKATQNMTNFSTMGSFAFSTIGSRATQAFKSIGAGSANAGDAMKTFFLGALGDMASKQGEMFLMQGLGFAATPGMQASSGVLLAEGAGLIALGGLLGAASSSSSSVGGSAAAAPSAATPGSASAAAPPLGAGGIGKAVTVQIMGSLYETSETKQRLLEMIREETDASAFTYKQIGV